MALLLLAIAGYLAWKGKMKEAKNVAIAAVVVWLVFGCIDWLPLVNNLLF